VVERQMVAKTTVSDPEILFPVTQTLFCSVEVKSAVK